MVSLHRRVVAELIGSALLAAIVIGSGIAAQRLSPNDVGLQLFENALITGAGLVALILTLGPVSAAFNPVVTLVEHVLARRLSRETLALAVTQVIGCCLGAIVANLMFDLDAVSISEHERSAAHLWLGETVATFGLVLVIFGLVRSGRSHALPYAVGGYITAAYWFTSSTSFANPAITVGRTLSDSFAGIAPSSVPLFVVFQLVGAALGLLAVRVLYPEQQPTIQEQAA